MHEFFYSLYFDWLPELLPLFDFAKHSFRKAAKLDVERTIAAVCEE